MSAQLKAELENARQCLLESYNLALTYGAADSQDEQTFFNLAAKLGQISEQSKIQEEALECAKEARSMDEFEQIFKQELQKRESKKYNPKNTASFKNFKHQMAEMKSLKDGANEAAGSGTSRVECDEFVMESEINVYDPLTKQRMHNPVRNTRCGHHYEKSSILEAIHINKRLRCPVAGCGNKEFVKQQDLQDDHLFKARLEQANQESDED